VPPAGILVLCAVLAMGAIGARKAGTAIGHTAKKAGHGVASVFHHSKHAVVATVKHQGKK